MERRGLERKKKGKFFLSLFSLARQIFRPRHFDFINKFVEAHSYHFTPLDSLNDNVTDTDDDSDLVADVDPDTLIRIVLSELKVVMLQV